MDDILTVPSQSLETFIQESSEVLKKVLQIYTDSLLLVSLRLDAPELYLFADPTNQCGGSHSEPVVRTWRTHG